MATASYNPRILPAYTTAEAARYLSLSRTTLVHWVSGRNGERRMAPVIQAAQRSPHAMLSFENLVEAFVLSALRVKHEVSLREVRAALRYVSQEFKVTRPLLDQQFYTGGGALFVERYGELIRASKPDQVSMAVMMRFRLQRVERDDHGVARRLFPFIDTRPGNDTRILIDPCLGFGRPVIAGTGIRIEIIGERFRAGDSIEELAFDYNVAADDIRQALRVQGLEAAA